MLVYWLMFLMPAFAALSTGTNFKRDKHGLARMTPSWMITWMLLVVLIGLRYQVGGDWYNYLEHFYDDFGVPFLDLVQQSDPAYQTLTWIAIHLDLGIYGVNVMGAVLFVAGLLPFCRSMPRPWLALAVAMPYMVIVVAMGYTRQGIALGLAMLGLLALQRRSTKGFAAWVLAGASFHRSAVLLLPIAGLAAARKRIWIAAWMGAIALVGYVAFLERDVDTLYLNYIQRGYESQGAMIRLTMNAVAGMIYLLLQRRFGISRQATLLWRWIAILAVAMLATFIVAPSASTALDRLGLYLLPLQVLVFSHLPGLFGSGRARKLWIAAILSYYASILAVWLLFANNAYAWRPYQNWLLIPGT